MQKKMENQAIHIKDTTLNNWCQKLSNRKEIKEETALNSNSIGISNVIHRLRIYYKDLAEIKVHSKLHEGTEFVLIIPEPIENSENISEQ